MRAKMRRTPLGFQTEERQHLASMLLAGVIQPSTSEWASAPVVVRKKDGGVRWFVDYGDVNARTTKIVSSLPLINECLDALSGNIWFPTLDMASGYWQAKVCENDRRKTPFLQNTDCLSMFACHSVYVMLPITFSALYGFGIARVYVTGGFGLS